MKKLFSFVLIFSIICFNIYGEDIINTVVGNDMPGYNGDGIKADYASLYTPMGVSVDEFGRIYIADTQNNRIRMVDDMNVIHTVAGTGVFGYNGDEQKAVNCAFAFPMGIHLQTANKEKKTVNVYIADTRNNKIRMINEFGITRTIAGSGRFHSSGDFGPAIKADLRWPASVTLDNDGNIYISDTYNHKIRVVYMGGSIAGDINKKIIPNPKKLYIYTLVGTGKDGYGGDGQLANQANLRAPWDCYPVNGELYISDKNNHIIRKVGKDGIITTVAGVPSIPGYYGDVLKATEEKLNTPYGIWADANGIYVADAMNSRIRKIDDKKDAISTICGIGDFGFGGDGAPAPYCMLSHPVDIFGDGKGSFYISDLVNGKIRVIKPEEGRKAGQPQPTN